MSLKNSRNETANPAEKLTRMRLIAGTEDDAPRKNILQELIAEMTSEQIVEFTMQLDLCKSFVSSSGKAEDPANTQPNINIHASN